MPEFIGDHDEEIRVRFTWRPRPFVAYIPGRRVSVARWTPLAARTRLTDLLDHLAEVRARHPMPAPVDLRVQAAQLRDLGADYAADMLEARAEEVDRHEDDQG